MSDIIRFGISIPADLIASFDQFIAERHYTNRSEAIRDLIREKLVQREWAAKIKGKQVIGTITSVYDHHKRELLNKLTDLQHDFHENIISSQHIHLDHHNCLEVIIVRGEAEKVRQLADKLNALKGIKHSQLTMTTSGLDLK
ncbi:MAG: nickel-responsive transcriptional regulator NikR [Thermodesulfobacteriota bacterium]